MLKLYIGEEGSGRTSRIHEEFRQESSVRRTILIVPEQITFNAQKKLILPQSGRGILESEVLSFRRLAHRVLEETGQSDLVSLDEVGKSMLLYRIVQEELPNLSYYRSSAHSQGFLKRLKDVFSEFSQYEIGEDQLNQALDKAPENSSLHAKLSDFIRILRRYQEEMLQYGEISEKLLDRLADTIPESRYLAGASVFADDFYGYTPQQMRVFSALLSRAKDLTVVLTLPEEVARETLTSGIASRGDLFDTGRATLLRFAKLAEERHEPMRTEYFYGDRKTPLSYMARAFFQNRKPVAATMAAATSANTAATMAAGNIAATTAAQSGESAAREIGSRIHLFSGPDIRTEMRTVFDRIVYLVRDRGYRYREIGIALCDYAGYAPYLRQLSDEYGIPVFMDETSGVMAHPFVRMILSLFQILRTRCSYDTFLSFLKTGFTPFTREQTDLFDNMALERGWRGVHRMLEGLRTVAAGAANEQEADLYLDIFSEFLDTATHRSKAPAKEWCALLTRFLEVSGVEKVLEHQASKLHEDGFYLREAQCRQLFEKADAVIRRIAEIMPDTEMDADTFCGILAAGLSEVKVGMLPPEIDQITAGDLTRSRFQDLKVLFIAGFGEDNFPHIVQDQGLLLERERDQLADVMTLAPGGIGQICDQQFRLYILLNTPREELYVSYEARMEKGEAKGPSLYWNRFAEIGGPDVLSPLPSVVSLAEPAFQRFCEAEEKDPVLQQWFMTHEPYADRLAGMSGAGGIISESLSPASAGALWDPRDQEVSITRMETYGRCPYRYFLRYGLQLQERDPFEATLADDGQVLHTVMEDADNLLQRFFSEDVDDEEIEQIVDTLFARSEEQYQKYADNSRYHYYWHKLKKNAGYSLIRMRDQLRIGDYRPEYFEWKFGNRRGSSLPPLIVPLADGQLLRIDGVVDRVDLYDTEGKTYVRVIDYKSGAQSFSERDIWDGVSMQLPVYLDAVCSGLQKQGRSVHPAGILYFSLTPSVVSVEDDWDEDKIEDKLRKESRLDGVISSTKEALEGMAREGTINDLVPVRVLKNGGINKADQFKVRSERELSGLSRFTERRIAQFADRSRQGFIAKLPFRKGDEKACTRCPYRECCDYDIRIRGAEERRSEYPGPQAFWQRMEQEGADETDR